jgi:UDP-N-acetylmuramoyl-tripeptide--D-alanyl-D-alanine ligase
MTAADAITSMMTLRQVAAWLPGAAVVGNLDVAITRVHTDTRTLQAGDLFVALHGENFDANSMLVAAKSAGAVAALCHPGASGGFATTGLPCVEVDDTLVALGTLARCWRAQFSLPLIAVAGSNGKTTVTQMVASILRAAQPDATLATQGNLNNEIGLPLTLLRLRASHRLAVVELGMNHPGEIARLASIARPTVALVNNAQREHLEFMETVQAVAQENGAVLAALPADGVAIFPADDEYAPVWRELAGTRPVATFAWEGDADVTADEPRWIDGAWQVHAHTPAGPLAYRLHIAGRHNVKNSLAAISCALAAAVPPQALVRGLESFEPVKGRSRVLAVLLDQHPLTLVDDCYNANPDSVLAAIDVLAALPGPRLLVLGDMGEVGDQGPKFHAEVGAQARRVRLEHVLTIGDLSRHATKSFGDGRHFDNMEALHAAVLALLPQVSSILVKGSRFMRMVRVVDFVIANTRTLPVQAHQSAEAPHAA